MIVAVFFGSRDWTDAHAVEEVVEELTLKAEGALKVISGGARGLDSLAAQVMRRRGAIPTEVPAQWHVHDRAGATPVPCNCALPRPGEEDTCRRAGHRRNQLMIDTHLMPAIADPDLDPYAVGFRTSGRSPGTDDMRDRIKPLVEAGHVTGIFKRAGGVAPPERRKLWTYPDRSKGLEPWPPPPWPEAS